MWKEKPKNVLAAICIVTLITVVSTVVFLKYGLPKTYTLTTTAFHGSVKKRPNKTRYKHGEKITLETVPNVGYSFIHWSGDLSGSTKTITLIMESDKSVIANCALVETNSIGMKLVYIPPGEFMMGISSSTVQLLGTKREYFADELPQHQVRISEGFWMGQTEVTQGQYRSVMNDWPWHGKVLVRDSDNDPAYYVTWDEAVEFCRKLSQREGKAYRLPTEAEWEYTCRAGTKTRFSFGDNDSPLDDYAWFIDNTHGEGKRYPHSVGQKKPNPWGLYDMHGNVWEWCSDYYDEKYYYNSPNIDPKGPPTGINHSVRGGSWGCDVDRLHCSKRFYCYPGRNSGVGFRVVRSQP